MTAALEECNVNIAAQLSEDACSDSPIDNGETCRAEEEVYGHNKVVNGSHHTNLSANKMDILNNKQHYINDKPSQCFKMQFAFNEIVDLSQNTLVNKKELVQSVTDTHVNNNTVLRTHSDNNLVQHVKQNCRTHHYDTTGKFDQINHTKYNVSRQARNGCSRSSMWLKRGHEISTDKLSRSSIGDADIIPLNSSHVTMSKDIENNNHFNSLQRAVMKLKSSENSHDQFHLKLQVS